MYSLTFRSPRSPTYLLSRSPSFCFPRPSTAGEQPSVMKKTSCASRREEAGRPRGFRGPTDTLRCSGRRRGPQGNLLLYSSFSPFWWLDLAGVLNTLSSISPLLSPLILLPPLLSSPFFLLLSYASHRPRTSRKLSIVPGGVPFHL